MFITVRIVKSLDRINFNLKMPRNENKNIVAISIDGLALLLLGRILFACFAINTASCTNAGITCAPTIYKSANAVLWFNRISRRQSPMQECIHAAQTNWIRCRNTDTNENNKESVCRFLGLLFSCTVFSTPHHNFTMAVRNALFFIRHRLQWSGALSRGHLFFSKWNFPNIHFTWERRRNNFTTKFKNWKKETSEKSANKTENKKAKWIVFEQKKISAW